MAVCFVMLLLLWVVMLSLHVALRGLVLVIIHFHIFDLYYLNALIIVIIIGRFT